MKRWRCIGLSAAGIIAVAFAATFFLPAKYQICGPSNYAQPKDCAQYHLGPYAVSWIVSVLDAHSGLVTALATVFVAGFTWTLWLSSRDAARLAAKTVGLSEQQTLLQGMQSDILEKQKEIQRQQFFAEHRPRLVLKDVYFSTADDFSEVTVEMVNSGQSLALITGGFVGLDFVGDEREFKNAANRTLGPLSDNRFKAGQFRPFGFVVTEETQRRLDYLIKQEAPDTYARVGNTFYNEVNKPAGPFYFFGAICYADGRGEDGGGSTYLSVFRRRWEPRDGRFYRTNGPYDEYAD